MAALRVLPPVAEAKFTPTKESSLCVWPSVPECISDDVEVCTNLAKEGLSDLERYHAKLGDVGVKAMKRAFPTLKIPEKFRCEHCIDGKIHKFGHSKCASGDRTQYAPGECIHSDHSGPYTRSIGGARYSQLFWTVDPDIYGLIVWLRRPETMMCFHWLLLMLKLLLEEI